MFETVHKAICDSCGKTELTKYTDKDTPEGWRLIRVEVTGGDTQTGSTGLYCTDCWKRIRRAMNVSMVREVDRRLGESNE